MKKFIKWALWIVFAFAVIWTFYYLWGQGQPKEVKYEIVSVSSGDSIIQSLVIAGTIKPRDEVAVKPQIPGIVSEILVKPGQEVAVGDVIAKIVVIPDLQQINNAEGQLEQARINLRDVERIHSRNDELFRQGLIAAEEYERSKSELSRAEQQLRSANDALQITRSGVSSRYSKQSSTLVRATRSGKVLSIPVKVGASVVQANNFNEGTTIATIANMSDLIFEGQADETEVGKLQVGQQMLLTIGALPDDKIEAEVEYISPLGQSVSGATRFEVRGALKHLSLDLIARLRAGFSVNANVSIAKAINTITLPEACITYRADTAWVHFVKSEEPLVTEERVVNLGLSDGNRVEIKLGLKKGDKVRGIELYE